MNDILFMQRALDLAVLGEGNVAPNPLVGCVITQNDKIIGEGYHQKYGEAHAEVNAINSVLNKNLDENLLKDSTFYVSLEPCSHFGKTPPCADLLIKYQPKKVVICNLDSNPLVAGEGVEKLQNAGIEVISGILEAEGKFVNRRFFTFMEKKRPYIFLKWAQTIDGFLAHTNTPTNAHTNEQKQISNAHTRPYTHKWRTQEAAIMVGTNTVKTDNPRLDARFWVGNNPIRIFIDKNLSVSPESHLLDQTIPTLCYNFIKNETKGNLVFVRLENKDNDILENILENILEDLYKRKILSVMVEGGTMLLNTFLEKNIWDEIAVFQSKKRFFEGIKAPLLNISPNKIIPIQEDNLLHYFVT